MKHLANNMGNVDDIRIHLRQLQPETAEEAEEIIEYLQKSYFNELFHSGRNTVLQMLFSKIAFLRQKYGIEI